jgi:hypothetical protein
VHHNRPIQLRCELELLPEPERLSLRGGEVVEKIQPAFADRNDPGACAQRAYLREDLAYPRPLAGEMANLVRMDPCRSKDLEPQRMPTYEFRLNPSRIGKIRRNADDLAHASLKGRRKNGIPIQLELLVR